MTARSRGRGAAFWRVLSVIALILTSAGMAPFAGIAPTVSAQTVGTAVPRSPELATPPNGETVDDAWGGVVLEWEPVPGAVEYQVILNDGERTGPWVTETSWSPGTLPAGTYTWSVRARNAAGPGTPGREFSFTISPPAENVSDPNSPSSLPFPLKQQAPWLNVAATSAIVNTPLTVNGAGFASGERVVLYWDDPRRPPLLETTANDVGAWTEAVPIPDDVMAEHRIIALGEESNVEAAGTVSIIPSIERPVASGLPGTEVGVLLQGFAAEETVDLRWGGENGPSIGIGKTNATGSGRAKIVLPEAEAGAYDVIGLGQRSGGKALSAFRVEQRAEAASAENAPETLPAEPVAGGMMVGPASFLVTATVEGLVGGTTSSGHQIVPDDHFVSLPACTNTSCPWLEPGVEHELFGQRLECGDLCYVKVENPETGACSVAPVLETGPWFTLDNWWDPAEARWLNRQPGTVNVLPQGYTGADAAHDGYDVGFGRTPDGIGISNKGYVVGNRSGMDLANGTWQDIGYSLDVGIGTVIATMLWQTGERPEDVAAQCQPAAVDLAVQEEAPAGEPPADTPTDQPANDSTADPAATPAAGTPVPVENPPASDTAETTAAGADGADGTDGASVSGGDGGDGGDDGAGGDGGDGVAGGDGGDATAGVDGADGQDGQDGQPSEPDQVGRDGQDGADGQDGRAGQDGQPGEDAVDVSRGDSSGDGDRDKDRDERGKKERERKDREREERDRRGRNASNGNGGVSEVVADPVYFEHPAEPPLEQPVELAQEDQNAEDATASSTGESGTVNGVPRETAEDDPAAPGGPGEVILPPSVPTVPGAVPPGQYEVTSPSVNPEIAGGIASTSELTFNAIADTTVFTSVPDAPQSPESVGYLAMGGPQGAIALISFEVSGIGEGAVISALLTFTGAGAAGAPGGPVEVVYNWVVPEGLTANSAPRGPSALNVHGVPAYFEAVEPGGLTAVDVTGSVTGDGIVTFILPGQPEGTAQIYALESGVPPQLVLTVAVPA